MCSKGEAQATNCETEVEGTSKKVVLTPLNYVVLLVLAVVGIAGGVLIAREALESIRLMWIAPRLEQLVKNDILPGMEDPRAPAQNDSSDTYTADPNARIKRHVIVWDAKKQALHDAMWRLPSDRLADPGRPDFTLIIVYEDTFPVGAWWTEPEGGGAGHISGQRADICLMNWPEKEWISAEYDTRRRVYNPMDPETEANRPISIESWIKSLLEQ
jgi:hypothetical protein